MYILVSSETIKMSVETCKRLDQLLGGQKAIFEELERRRIERITENLPKWPKDENKKKQD